MEIVAYVRKVAAENGTVDEGKVDAYFSTYGVFGRKALSPSTATRVAATDPPAPWGQRGVGPKKRGRKQKPDESETGDSETLKKRKVPRLEGVAGGAGKGASGKRAIPKKDALPFYLEQAPDFTIQDVPADLNIDLTYELTPLYRSRKTLRWGPGESTLAIAKPRRPTDAGVAEEI